MNAMTSAELLVSSRPTARPAPVQTPQVAEATSSGPRDRNGELSQVDTSNLSYVESLYQEYLKSPDLVTSEWREYFRHLTEAVARQPGSPDPFKAPRVGTGTVVSPVELDASIQRLTQTGADAAAVLQLTGVYHNLLRQWAET